LRHATSTDHADDGQEVLVLTEAQRLTSHLPMLILDVEVMLDGPIIVHAAFWAPCDADPVLAQLSTTLGRPVRLLDVSQTPTVDDPPEPACGTGCGSGGCSSESGCSTKSGGCSTSTCSRHAVKSADDLTAYFAALRKQMESTFGRRTSLN
jgi:hypothetical protein